jgi:hypothetical protein
MIFAQIKNNTIINTIDLEDVSLLSLFQTDQNGNPYDSVIQIDNIIPQPSIGWSFDNVNWNPPVAAPVSQSAVAIYTALVQQAIAFGQALTVQFATQNVMAGITQSGQTQNVLNYASNLYVYLNTGSLYVAIAEIETMIADTSSTKTSLAPFITNDILYAYLNQIQGYLQIPLTPNPGP